MQCMRMVPPFPVQQTTAGHLSVQSGHELHPVQCAVHIIDLGFNFPYTLYGRTMKLLMQSIQFQLEGR